MPYKLSMLPCWDGDGSILELGYADAVPYGERLQALDEMSIILQTTTIRRILVDFTQAHLQSGSDADRVDFVSRSIVSPGFDGCRVAMLGLESNHARTFATTAHVRQLDARLFEDRDEALDWLCSTVPGEAPA